MKRFIVGAADEGRRLERWLRANAPSLPPALMQKFVRLKQVKLNGKPARVSDRLTEGDELTLYIPDEFFAPRVKADRLLSAFKPRISVVYEDSQILIADKPPGLITHPDAREKVDTLVTHARAYLYQKGAYESMDARAFAPTPVNRLDRFTGGLVLVAKTREALDALNAAMRAGDIYKRYLCVVAGAPRASNGTLDNYIKTDERAARVAVYNSPVPGAKRALTEYTVLRRSGGTALIECLLVTGRTHQIRAQLSHMGHPILGDKQYAPREAANARAYQALYAYRVDFSERLSAPALSRLRGRTFALERVPFLREYYPDFNLRGEAD